MFILRKAVLATALAALAIGSAAAQTNGREVKLARALNATAATMAAQPPPTLTNPVAYISLRGGGMISPRGGALVGADVSLPTLSIGPGWHGRVSGDVIFKANFGGVDTIVPVTLDQIYFAPNPAGGPNFYWGGGLGAILSGPAKFDGKLILGADITTRLGAELNVHFNEEDTLVTILARLHL